MPANALMNRLGSPLSMFSLQAVVVITLPVGKQDISQNERRLTHVQGSK